MRSSGWGNMTSRFCHPISDTTRTVFCVKKHIDCEQSLFSSKFRGKERKTNKVALRSFPRNFEEKRDCSQSKKHIAPGA